MISDYLESLTEALGFDRSLSRCVRQEVEDHLCEMVAADPTHDRREAEQRAIASFGHPHLLAAQFAVISLARRTRSVGVGVVLAIAAVLATMKARVAWYSVVQWTMSEDASPLTGTVGSIDRYAFWLAVIMSAGALASIVLHRSPAALHPRYRRPLGRAFLLCAAATGALVVSVISDGVLTALHIGTEFCALSLIPIASMVIEIACAGAVILLILDTTRRAASTAALLKM